MIYAVPKKIAIISPPFVGHYRILFNLAARLIASDNNIHITFIITGWTHVSLSDLERKKFDISRMTLIEMDGGIFQRPAPFYFTFPRVTNLIERVIKACEDHMYIIYDTFSLEGYIAGQILGIPAICSVTGVMGPFDSRLPLFSQAITDNGPIINQLEDTYKISLLERIQMLGDGYFIASDYQTIQWSWPKLIEIDDYSCNRSLVNNQFMRPLNNRTCAVRSLEEKIIYFSLGTVVTTHLWSHSQSLQRFVRKILESIVEKFDGRHGYRVIISAGRKVSDLFTTIPRNFLVSESLPQLDILSQSNLFITHGGGNSVNEAIDAGVPMIVIPFFGDQHQSAANVQKLGIGHSFMHEEHLLDRVIDASSGLYERPCLTDKNSLYNAIDFLLHENDCAGAFMDLKRDEHINITNLNRLSLG